MERMTGNSLMIDPEERVKTRNTKEERNLQLVSSEKSEKIFHRKRTGYN